MAEAEELKDLTPEEMSWAQLRSKRGGVMSRAVAQIARQQAALAAKDAEIARPKITSTGDALAAAPKAAQDMIFFLNTQRMKLQSELATLKARTCETCQHAMRVIRETGTIAIGVSDDPPHDPLPSTQMLVGLRQCFVLGKTVPLTSNGQPFSCSAWTPKETK